MRLREWQHAIQLGRLQGGAPASPVAHGCIALVQSGRIVFQGPPSTAISYFARHGALRLPRRLLAAALLACRARSAASCPQPRPPRGTARLPRLLAQADQLPAPSLKRCRHRRRNRCSAPAPHPTSAGFPCPPLTNPADHVMDVIATPPPSARGGSLAAGARCHSTESFMLQEPPVIE